jgi:hypothetical protein
MKNTTGQSNFNIKLFKLQDHCLLALLQFLKETLHAVLLVFLTEQFTLLLPPQMSPPLLE